MPIAKKLTPGRHDALVLVHPTWSGAREVGEYPKRAVEAVDLATESGIPVLLVPDEGDDSQLSRELAARHLITVPSYIGNRRVKNQALRRRLQREVDFLAGQVGKTPSEIHLGFGGIYADACVLALAQGWCREVSPWWPESRDRQLRKRLNQQELQVANPVFSRSPDGRVGRRQRVSPPDSNLGSTVHLYSD